MSEQARELVERLDGELAGEISADPYVVHLYARDASMYAIEPLAVARPRHADDVAALVACAGQLGVPVIARGAGTSLAGQTVGRGVVVDFSRHMRRVVSVDPDARVARVEPGVVQEQLNAAAAPHGLMFGADTSTNDRATLGGMIGNNSSGTMSVTLGTTATHVRSLDVVLADGSRATAGPGRGWSAGASPRAAEISVGLDRIAADHGAAIRRDYPRLWRTAGGYRLNELVRDEDERDLAKLLVGSEGTLALALGAEVDLVPRPAAQAIAVGHFRSVPEALAATGDALARSAAAVELMDSLILDLARSKHEYAQLTALLEGSPGALLFVTFLGESEAEAESRVRELESDWRRHGHGYHVLRAVSAEERTAVMKVRRASLGLLMSASTGTRRPLAFVEDTAVAPEALEQYVARFAAVLQRHGLTAGYYGHCSVGCLHLRPFVDVRNPPEERAMAAVAREVLELVLEFGGVNSSEHGDGLARSEFNERFFGRELYGAMRALKRLFDPDGLLNPGKIVDAPPMTEHLRDRDLPAAVVFASKLDFGEGGMRGAADRCMNIGICRKTGTGVMCPSYMATLEEEHSTRGRANALVRALSEPLAAGSLVDDRLFEILDLCLECKACTSECPLSVDMAALKSEFLYHYQRARGIPPRSRLFAAARTVGQLGSATAPISNLVGAAPPVRWALERALGITTRRRLPRYERQTLMKWYAGRSGPERVGRQAALVFVADSFTSFSEPTTGRAAIELLELAGWDVRLEARGCCGRAAYSKGLLDQARASADALVDRLLPFAEQGVPITGCEPSCLLMIRDEYPRLVGNRAAAATVAAAVCSASSLVVDAIRMGTLVLDSHTAAAGREILFQPHCHERAGGEVESSLALLRAIPQASVHELDAGCCGMAGSFGFEVEHYDLSIRIGSRRLFPAVRAVGADTTIAATGVSCRQQIRHGTGRVALHPLQIVHALVLPSP